MDNETPKQPRLQLPPNTRLVSRPALRAGPDLLVHDYLMLSMRQSISMIELGRFEAAKENLEVAVHIASQAVVDATMAEKVANGEMLAEAQRPPPKARPKAAKVP